ncbi:hypothetical protein E2562_017428 [Oryza meyeriana var. granulata]|uniref:Uncharacterized protein n=1 Tax=Oryza meyeriana var. granulata TaxID=110450 RepID=A0A6G1D6V3_9ORYZ|nr:hypothetical protein E2562_017428 [Oryza meyeriana var. granulata]
MGYGCMQPYKSQARQPSGGGIEIENKKHTQRTPAAASNSTRHPPEHLGGRRGDGKQYAPFAEALRRPAGGGHVREETFVEKIKPRRIKMMPFRSAAIGN